MRKALNENPVVQMVVLGIMAVVAAVVLFTMVLKGDEAPVADPATATGTPPVEGVAADPAAATPSTPATPATPVPAPSGEVPETADVLAAGEGLPKDLATAFADQQVIALLVIEPKGDADKKVKLYTERLGSRDGVEVFVTDVENIADYSRITTGVSVNRAPALIVIKPRRLTDDVPTASISYGFRSPRSVEQALDDALYAGDPIATYPLRVDRAER